MVEPSQKISVRNGCLSRRKIPASTAIFLQFILLIAAAFVTFPVARAQSSAAIQSATVSSTPIAIVSLDTKNPKAAAKVSGALEVSQDRAIIAASGAVTAGSSTAEVVLPHRGVLRVCATTTVKLTADSSVPAGEVPGLMMSIERGAVEVSFATGRNSDIILTPDFRILIGGPGSADVKVRLGQNGDTCVDNPGASAPYVLVSSVFDSGAYRVQPGQRVMFQHGSLREVVDQEKEPCGCPPATSQGNEFPLAQSEGLASVNPPAVASVVAASSGSQAAASLVYNSADHMAPAAAPAGAATEPDTAVKAGKPALEEKKPGFFRRVGRFFKRVFGAE
jgi:hypothetical protein